MRQCPSMLLGVALALAVASPGAWAGPWRHRDLPQPHPPRRYVAVPIEDVQLIREVRQAPHSNHRYNPEPVPRYEEPQPQATDDAYGPEEPRGRYERQSGGGGEEHEYVDYGAHTGHHGAFGWYADFPVISKGHR